MAKPYVHAKSSARKFGGVPEDYQEIHDWFDATKSLIADNRHRVLRHHSEGIFLCEQIFGKTRTNSDGKVYSVRDIGEQHVLEDFGNKFIPTPQDYIVNMALQLWMNGSGIPPSQEGIPKSVTTVIDPRDIVFDKPSRKLVDSD